LPLVARETIGVEICCVDTSAERPCASATPWWLYEVRWPETTPNDWKKWRRTSSRSR